MEDSVSVLKTSDVKQGILSVLQREQAWWERKLLAETVSDTVRQPLRSILKEIDRMAREGEIRRITGRSLPIRALGYVKVGQVSAYRDEATKYLRAR